MQDNDYDDNSNDTDNDKNVKLSLSRPWRHIWRVNAWLHSFSTATDTVEWPTSRPGRFIPSSAAHDPTPRDNHEQKLLEYSPLFPGMYYHVNGVFLHLLIIPSNESTLRGRITNGCQHRVRSLPILPNSRHARGERYVITLVVSPLGLLDLKSLY
jgi:hypothetical protein